MAYSAEIPAPTDRSEDDGILLPNTVMLNSTGNNLPIVHSKEIKGGLHYVEYLEYLNENSYRGISIARREVGTTIAYIARYWNEGTDEEFAKYFKLISMEPDGSNPIWEEWKSTVNVTPSGRPAFVRANIAQRDALLQDENILPAVGPGDIAIIMDASGDLTAFPPLEGGATYILDDSSVWQRFLFPKSANDQLAHAKNNDTQIIAQMPSGNVILTGEQIKTFMDAYSALQDGKSAYQLAKDLGFEGSELQWLDSLNGRDGIDGLPGQNGQDGLDGLPGLSAYELEVQNGYTGTYDEWRNSLKGDKGEKGDTPVFGEIDITHANALIAIGNSTLQLGREYRITARPNQEAGLHGDIIIQASEVNKFLIHGLLRGSIPDYNTYPEWHELILQNSFPGQPAFTDRVIHSGKTWLLVTDGSKEPGTTVDWRLDPNGDSINGNTVFVTHNVEYLVEADWIQYREDESGNKIRYDKVIDDNNYITWEDPTGESAVRNFKWGCPLVTNNVFKFVWLDASMLNMKATIFRGNHIDFGYFKSMEMVDCYFEGNFLSGIQFSDCKFSNAQMYENFGGDSLWNRITGVQGPGGLLVTFELSANTINGFKLYDTTTSGNYFSGNYFTSTRWYNTGNTEPVVCNSNILENALIRMSATTYQYPSAGINGSLIRNGELSGLTKSIYYLHIENIVVDLRTAFVPLSSQPTLDRKTFARLFFEVSAPFPLSANTNSFVYGLPCLVLYGIPGRSSFQNWGNLRLDASAVGGTATFKFFAGFALSRYRFSAAPGSVIRFEQAAGTYQILTPDGQPVVLQGNNWIEIERADDLNPTQKYRIINASPGFFSSTGSGHIIVDTAGAAMAQRSSLQISAGENIVLQNQDIEGTNTSKITINAHDVRIQPGYDNTYYVSANGNDSTAILNVPKFPYRNIKTATTLAAADVLAGKRPFVYVYTGVYNDHHITRHKVDMYFERKAIVYGNGTNNATLTANPGPPGNEWSDGPVISDWTDNVPTGVQFNIYGQGEFYSKTSHWASDRVGINCYKTLTKITVEAAAIDGLDMWGGGYMELNLKNVEILFHFGQKNNKKFHLENCKLMSGFTFGGYLGFDQLIEMEDCEYILPIDKNQYNNVYDVNGNLAVTLNNGNWDGIDISAMTHEQVNDLQHDNSGMNNLIGAIAYMENSFQNYGNNFNNCKIHIRNPKIRIRRNKCAGIRIQCRYDNPGLEIAIHNPTIFDETVERQTTGIVIGKLSTVPSIMRFGIEGPLADVAIFKVVPTGMVPIPATFKTDITENTPPTNPTTPTGPAADVYTAKFNTAAIVPDIQYLKGKCSLAEEPHPLISALNYQISMDGGLTYISYADLAAVNGFGASASAVGNWEIKRVPIPTATVGPCAIKVTITPITT